MLDVDGTAASAYTQRGNVLHGAAGASYVWNGKVVKSAAALATLSGQGAGDRDIDARLGSIDPAATDFRLAEDSPARDTGVRDPAGLTVEPGCDGAANHYCGSAPEPGAIELAGDGIGSTSTPDNGVVTRKADPAASVVDPPANVVASVRGITATITWRAPKSGAAAYIVSGAGVATTTVKTPRAVIGKLRAGSTYTVRVTTVDRVGNRSAAASIRVRVAPALRASQVPPAHRFPHQDEHPDPHPEGRPPRHAPHRGPHDHRPQGPRPGQAPRRPHPLRGAPRRAARRSDADDGVRRGPHALILRATARERGAPRSPPPRVRRPGRPTGGSRVPRRASAPPAPRGTRCAGARDRARRGDWCRADGHGPLGVSRYVRHGTPSAEVSSCTPPESVTTSRASACRQTKSR